MSDYHRHNPELAETIDAMFGVHVTTLADAEPPAGPDLEQVADDIDVLSRMALTPVEDAWKAYELLKLMVADRWARERLTGHFKAAERLLGQGGMSDDDMNQAHRRDSSAERSITDASRALKAMLANPDTIGRLTLVDRGKAEELARSLDAKAAHIVAVWD